MSDPRAFLPQVFEVNIHYLGVKPRTDGSFRRDECEGNRYFKFSLEPFNLDKEEFDAWHDSIKKEVERLEKTHLNLEYFIEISNPNELRSRVYFNIDAFSSYLEKGRYISPSLNEVVVENPKI